MPCGVPSLRQRWTRCERPRSFSSVTTHDPSCTGLRSASRHPWATTEPATSGLSSSQGGGDAVAAESGGGGPAFGRSRSPAGSAAGRSVAARGGRTDATAAPAAVRVNAAVAPTAALPINSRRESIVHPLLRRNERPPPHPVLIDTLVMSARAGSVVTNTLPERTKT